MAKADVLRWVQTFAAGLADPALLERFYRDLVWELGRQPILVTFGLLAADPATGTFTLPEDAVTLYAVLYDDTALTRATPDTLAVVDEAWPSAHGRPIAFVTEGETARTFRLYPQPDAPSKPFTFLTGTPIGLDYPTQAVCLVYSERRDTAPLQFELPLALTIVAREFARESPHSDTILAQTVQQLATAMLVLL